ncbi:transmembrane protein 267 isoform X2 [Hetaerina americana]|uniref:transmembrane protein 267 isoform X2 n=1 Tax=Hetaerina americana TaxID=62018 RepID=UPI003A7F3B4F
MVNGRSDIPILRSDFPRAICDNLTHGLIGFFSWYIVTSEYNLKNRIIESLFCAFFASAIDADHFISARSLYVKDAVRLSSRPFMHCTTLVIIITLLVRVVVKVLQFTHKLHAIWKRIDWLFLLATISHHIRDGSRRGLWLWPLPFWSSGNVYSTPPLPKVIYLILTMTLPHLLKYVILEDGDNPLPWTGNILTV